MAWLVRDGAVLASLELADSRRARVRGLLGRDDIEGALLIRPCKQVHTAAMRFAIDVAFCDQHGQVLRASSMKPWRISAIVFGAAFAIEARAGAFERWRLTIGDVVEVRE